LNITGKVELIECTASVRLFVAGFLVLFSSQLLRAQDNQNQSVDVGETTKPITMPDGGCAYEWEVIDGKEIGFPAASGNSSIPSFTAVNNTKKPITAHIRVKPSSDNGFAYIPNISSSNVTVVNTFTHNIVTHVAVDTRPYGVAVSPDGRYVYIVSTKDVGGHATNGVVSVIETTGNTVVGRYTVGENAAAIAVNPNGKRAYVVNEKTATISVLDLTSFGTIVVSISVKEPYGIGVSPDGSRLYVSSKSGQLYVIDTSDNQIIDQIPVSTHAPPSLVVSPDGAKVYVANQGATYMCVIDVAARTEQKVNVAGMSPFTMAITPEGDKLYVSTSSGITILNTADNSIKKSIPLPITQQRWGISISPNGKQVFLVAQNPDQIEVIDTHTDELEAPIPNDMQGALSVGNFITADVGCRTIPITYTITVNPSPNISDPGSIAASSTHYGIASTAQVINVGGNNLKGPITVTVPAGFEVSKDDITFKDTVMVPTAGDMVGTDVFVRLKATAPVDTYHGNIQLSSMGAGPVNVPIEGTVLTTQLNITADNKTKFFGDPLPTFTVTYTGFVNGDGPSQLVMLPTVTTTAIVSSPVGQYPINVDGASAKNYVITYVPGILEIITGEVSTPNAFTPNGDGINDTWDIKNLNLYAGCTIEVLNRYGQKIYYANGYPAPWNGTLNGHPVPVGTYYYIIKLKPGVKPLTGSVNIIR